MYRNRELRISNPKGIADKDDGFWGQGVAHRLHIRPLGAAIFKKCVSVLDPPFTASWIELEKDLGSEEPFHRVLENCRLRTKLVIVTFHFSSIQNGPYVTGIGGKHTYRTLKLKGPSWRF
jgi:hypothetical protein